MRTILAIYFVTFISLILFACNTQEVKSNELNEADTLGILKASLDSSYVYVKNTKSKRTADTSAFTSQFQLDTLMRRYFSRESTHKLKYLDNDSLCRIAQQLITTGFHSDKITNLISFKKDSVGDTYVILERDRLITETRVVKGDTIRSCYFGGAIEWMLIMKFKKIGNKLQPQVYHWEIH